jgi:hypothetical protein
MISQPNLEAALKKTVLLYNRLNGSQAVVKLVNFSPEMVIVSFAGPFCYECGDVQKYVEGFAKDFKVFVDFAELVPEKTRETTPHSVEATYVVKSR